jgi:hypothetical protein
MLAEPCTGALAVRACAAPACAAACSRLPHAPGGCPVHVASPAQRRAATRGQAAEHASCRPARGHLLLHSSSAERHAACAPTAQCSEAFLRLVKDKRSWLPHQALRLRSGASLQQYIHASTQVGAAAASWRRCSATAAATAAVCVMRVLIGCLAVPWQVWRCLAVLQLLPCQGLRSNSPSRPAGLPLTTRRRRSQPAGHAPGGRGSAGRCGC